MRARRPPPRPLVPLLLLLAGAAAAQPAPGELAAAEEAPPAAPVRFRGERLFDVWAPAQGLTPAQRAANIEGRLRALAQGPERVLQEIRTVEAADASGVVAGTSVVAAFGDADARRAGRTRQALAADAAASVREALGRDYQARAAGALARSALVALALTAAGALLLKGVRRLTRAAERRARARLQERLERPRQGQLLSLLHVDRLALAGVRLVRLALVVGVVAAWAVLVLGLFPWTRELAVAGAERLRAAGAWLVGGVVGYLPNLAYIALAVVVTRGLLRLMRAVAGEVAAGRLSVPGFYPDWAMPTYKVARLLVLALCLVVVYPYLPGSGSPAFKGISVFVGVVGSLGSSAAIANMVAGLVITYMRPFQLRDSIRIGDNYGVVIEKTLLVVRLRTLEGVDITVPNSAILQGPLYNFTAPTRREEGLVVETAVTIGYDVPWHTVEALMLAAARGTPGVVERPPPEVWQTELEDSYVRHTLRAAVDQPARRRAILAAINRRILDAFFAAGVEIMSPTYVAARDGNALAMPPEQRPAGAVPSAFRHRIVGAAEEPRHAGPAEPPARAAPQGAPAGERH